MASCCDAPHPALALGDVVACAAVGLVALVLLIFLLAPIGYLLVWRPYVLRRHARATRAFHRRAAASAGQTHDERPLNTPHFVLQRLHLKGHARFDYDD